MKTHKKIILKGLLLKKLYSGGRWAFFRQIQHYLGCLQKPFHQSATGIKMLIILGPWVQKSAT